MTTPEIARREALKRLVIGGVGAATAPAWVEELTARALIHPGPRTTESAGASMASWKPRVLTPYQDATVATITELIIPQTDTPGARAAKVNEFVDAILADETPAARNSFLNGLSSLDELSHRLYSADFIRASHAEQVALLLRLSQPSGTASPPDQAARDFFRAIKTLTITGYYTSEVGMKEELGDDATVFFADYSGCTHPGHRA